MMNAKTATISGLVGGADQALNATAGSKTGEGLPLYWIGRRDLPSERAVPALLHGPEHEVTRLLMADTGVILALSEYEKRGFSDLTGSNAYTYNSSVNKDKQSGSNVLLNRLAGVFPGGYRVEIRNLAGSSNGHKLVEISVSEHAPTIQSSGNPDGECPASLGKIGGSTHYPEYRWIESIAKTWQKAA